jgi:antitoxin HicB
MKYHFKVRKDQRSGFWAECLELKGCQTQGETEEELLFNMEEALNLYLDEPSDSKLIFPLPKEQKGRGIVAVPVQPRIAFAFLLRTARLKHHFTQRHTADLLGFKNISAYQKLEKSKTANPGLETLVKVKRVFPEIQIDDIAS